MDSNKVTKVKPKPTDDIKTDREVLREPGQISFKDAMKKAIVPRKKDKKNGK